jgi:hypothetical protein
LQPNRHQASHASLKNYVDALADAEKCVALQPSWAKVWLKPRRGKESD